MSHRFIVTTVPGGNFLTPNDQAIVFTLPERQIVQQAAAPLAALKVDAPDEALCEINPHDARLKAEGDQSGTAVPTPIQLEEIITHPILARIQAICGESRKYHVCAQDIATEVNALADAQWHGFITAEQQAAAIKELKTNEKLYQPLDTVRAPYFRSRDLYPDVSTLANF